MPIVHTQDIRPNSLAVSETLQIYCGLDCCVTLEVYEELSRTFNQPPAIYQFERALQGPYMEMMNRGFLVDDMARRAAASSLTERSWRLQRKLDQMAEAVWDKGLNSRSTQQLREFFYTKMRLPEVWISQKGERKLSTNREALEKLEEYVYARPFVASILTLRDIAKQLEVFETEIDSDGRFRTSYNIAGTETGRPSSSSNAFGTGGNAQNIAPALRYVFIADPGKKLAQIDLEQVEARDVGYFCGVLFNDWSYLDACESSDLHTVNAKRVWKERRWPGTPAADRAMADEIFYRDFSYRDMAKRGSHLSNYMGTAWTASRTLKLPFEFLDEFQARYCKGSPAKLDKHGNLLRSAITPAYPCIPRFWQWVATQLQTTNQLTTPFGRRRHFFGRPGDDTTLREAIAYLPQSTTADRMNLGMYKVWQKMPQIQLLAQTYDSITFQFDESADADKIICEALELIKVELLAPNGRSYVVPGEAKVGWNWGYVVTQQDVDRAIAAGRKPPKLNVEGLAKWKRGVPDIRQRRTGMQRRII